MNPTQCASGVILGFTKDSDISEDMAPLEVDVISRLERALGIGGICYAPSLTDKEQLQDVNSELVARLALHVSFHDLNFSVTSTMAI